jgi:hypothetical protein
MKYLVKATPNKDYVWKDTFKKCEINALFENEHVSFLEYFNGKVNTLSEELVLSLFPTDVSLRDRPFLIKENEMFYTILRRKNPRYTEKYQLIMEKIKTRKVVRRKIE